MPRDPAEQSVGQSMAANRDRLRAYIAAESGRLLRTLRLYVLRAGLAEARDAHTAASELLNEVVIEALADAHRFDAARDAGAWLFGIAANLIRRKQSTAARREWREPLVGDMFPDDGLSEEDLFDRVAAFAAPPDDEPDAALAVAQLLRPLSPDDRRVLQLAILHDLDGEALAHVLAISPGAARVRLHRALRRLRDALSKEGMRKEASHDPAR